MAAPPAKWRRRPLSACSRSRWSTIELAPACRASPNRIASSVTNIIAAVKSGAIQIKDSTCPAVYAALQAGEKGQPFAPLRGLIGSDVLASRPDYKVIENPFEPGDDIVLLPAGRGPAEAAEQAAEGPVAEEFLELGENVGKTRFAF